MPPTPANPNGSASAPAVPGPRCILLHPRGEPVPGDLLTSLSKRVKNIVVCSDVFAAMAEICADTTRTVATGPCNLILLLVQPERIPDCADLLNNLPVFAPRTACWKFDSRANPKLAPYVDSNGTALMARGETAAGVLKVHGGVRASGSMADSRQTSSHADGTTTSFPRSPRLAPASSSLPAVPDPAPRPHPDLTPVIKVTATRPTPAPAETNGHGVRPHRVQAPPSPSPAPARTLLTPEELRMLLGDDPAEPRP